VIIDTAGRLQVDDRMVMELVRVRQATAPREVLLVADAALGQEAVSVAEHFHRALDITGVILTKLDGDARGGAALSIRQVTGRPIKFAGVGEKVDDLEPFHPERMASRMLGMGDIVSLVEKAAAEVEAEDAARMAEKIRQDGFDFADFRDQLRQMRKMGGLESILGMLPGGDQMRGMPGFDEKRIVHMEAIINAMTPTERSRPEIIDFPRRRRLAKGSGTSLEEVGQLIRQFAEMRKMMKRTGLLSRLMSGKAALTGGGGQGGLMSRGSNVTPPARKKRRKGRR
jgi:signal recognition particle subunit SRP54